MVLVSSFLDEDTFVIIRDLSNGAFVVLVLKDTHFDS